MSALRQKRGFLVKSAFDPKRTSNLARPPRRAAKLTPERLRPQIRKVRDSADIAVLGAGENVNRGLRFAAVPPISRMESDSPRMTSVVTFALQIRLTAIVEDVTAAPSGSRAPARRPGEASHIVARRMACTPVGVAGVQERMRLRCDQAKAVTRRATCACERASRGGKKSGTPATGVPAWSAIYPDGKLGTTKLPRCRRARI